MSTQETLVDLFASKRCDEIGESDITRAFRKPNLAEVQDLPDYKDAFNLVSMAKRQIEIIAENYSDKSDQALQCLAELKRCREKSCYLREEFKITRQVIKKTLYRDWPGLQAEYDERCDVIEKWNDVFISYTNRDAVTTNQTYKKLIKHEGVADTKLSKSTRNYVARTIAKHLERGNVRGFIDYAQLQCGDDISDKICHHAEQSMTLVQLLEPTIFQEPQPPKRNWCLEEYNSFTEKKPPNADLAEEHNSCFFVLARGKEFSDIKPHFYPPTYEAWIERASRKLHLTLNVYAFPYDELSWTLSDIARQILEARKKLVDAMLEPWT